MRVEIPAKWHYDFRTGGVMFFKQEYVESADLANATLEGPKPEIIIGRHEYYLLLEYIKEHEQDVVKTDRTEDLKIIHRLLDILDSEVKSHV